MNKMDAVGADFLNVVKMIRERLQANPVIIQLPIGVEDSFRGIIDLIEMRAFHYLDDLGTRSEQAGIPADMLALANQKREEFLEAVADLDDELMAKYLEGEEVTADDIHRALRRGTLNAAIVPVLCGSSYRNKGVQFLLDAIVRYLPAPCDMPAVIGLEPGSEHQVVREVSDEAPFSALAFKVMADSYVENWCFPRIQEDSKLAATF